MARWLRWGAARYAWAPDVTRRQRHGDLITLWDMDLERGGR